MWVTQAGRPSPLRKGKVAATTNKMHSWDSGELRTEDAAGLNLQTCVFRGGVIPSSISNQPSFATELGATTNTSTLPGLSFSLLALIQSAAAEDFPLPATGVEKVERVDDLAAQTQFTQQLPVDVGGQQRRAKGNLPKGQHAQQWSSCVTFWVHSHTKREAFTSASDRWPRRSS